MKYCRIFFNIPVSLLRYTNTISINVKDGAGKKEGNRETMKKKEKRRRTKK
jgi:hypothetical protein